MKLTNPPAHVFIVVCLITFVFYGNTLMTLPCHETMIIKEDLAYKDAEDRCKAYNFSGLAVLHNQEALNSFLNATNSHTSSIDDYWVGLTYDVSRSERDYIWSNGIYYSGSPVVSSGCGIADSNGNHEIVNCRECRKSICADYVDYRNVYSFLEDTDLNQSEAEAKCLEKGFQRLAVLDSPEKLDYALSTKPWNNVYWIGMVVTASEDIVWTSGESVTWARWHPDSEPNHLDSQKCVRLSANGFATKPCDLKMGALCEKTEVPDCPVHIAANVKPPRTQSFTPKIQIEDAFPLDSSDVISTGHARSLMDCSLICAQTDSCKSSAYHEESKRCSSLLRRFTNDAWSLLKVEYGWAVVDKCG